MKSSVLVILVMTAFMALTGFECASTEMTTAKVAHQNRDYAAAIAALQKEVSKRPGNSTAWLMLAEMYEQLDRPIDANNALKSARAATTPALTPQQLTDSYLRQYNLWLRTYNRSLGYYQKDEFRRGLEVLDTATMIDADQWENLFLRASLLERLGDEAGTRKVYEQYITIATPTLERGVALGLGMGMTPEQVAAQLGEPTAKRMDTNGGVMYFQDKDIYVYFAPLEGRVIVEGWRSYPADYPEALRMVPVTFRTRPFITLAQEAYARAKDPTTPADQRRAAFDEALKHFQLLVRFDPEVQGVSAIVANIYNETGRTEEAMRLLNAEIAAHPKVARNYLELGNLHVPARRYQEAVTAFNKVLELGLADTDPSVKLALFNLGAVYKNWGADTQRQLNESVKDRTKITPAQAETYLKPLRESTKYFERLRVVSPEDIGVLSELANLYFVLGDDAKTTALVTQLEGYSERHANSRAYWLAMSRLYAVVLGDEAKSVSAENRAEAATEP